MTKRVSLWQTLIFSGLILAAATAGIMFSPMGKVQAHPEGWTANNVCVEWAQVDPNPPHCVEWQTFWTYTPPHDH